MPVASAAVQWLFGYNLLVVCAILALRVLVLIFRPSGLLGKADLQKV